MGSRREVVQELLPERILLVDAAGRQPLPCQALHGLSRRCWKVVVTTMRVVPQSEYFVSF